MEKVATATNVMCVRTEISNPLAQLERRGVFNRSCRILHFGAGHPNNPDRQHLNHYRTTHYDPNYGPTERTDLRNRDFQIVLALFVLNILQKEDRRSVLKDLALSADSLGTAYVAVRAHREVESASGRGQWLSYRDGYLVPMPSGLPHFQRGYTADELGYELGQWFRTCAVEDMGWYQLATCGEPYRTPPWRRLGNN